MDPYTIVVVEYDSALRANASLLLAEAGFAVEAYTSAVAAACLIDERAHGIGAVFTAAEMPGDMDGIDLAIRITTRWPKIMVLVTSGRSSERPAALPVVVGFMPKPWLPLNLLVTMQRAAEAWRFARET